MVPPPKISNFSQIATVVLADCAPLGVPLLVAGVAVLAEESWRKKGLNSSCIGTLCLYTFLDLSAYDGLKLCIKGDGSRYKLMVRISCDWVTVAYTIGFDVKDQWQSVRLPFSSLGPIFRA